jgi:hypothetical protein
MFSILEEALSKIFEAMVRVEIGIIPWQKGVITSRFSTKVLKNSFDPKG